MVLTYIAVTADSGKSVYDILLNRLQLSRKMIVKLKTVDDGIVINNTKVYTNRIVEAGDILSVNIDFREESLNIIPEEGPIDILYEDEYLIALNKPANTVVHPTHNYQSGTLSNFLAAYYRKIGLNAKIHPISRLDKGTTGVVLFAKNKLVKQRFSDKDKIQGSSIDLKFLKEYTALLHGVLSNACGTMDIPIARVLGSTIERCVSSTGANAITHYNTVETFRNDSYSLVEFILGTGRTHQIRVHCKYSGHPIVGETLYCSESCPDSHTNNLGMEHQALHSHKVSFIHPITGKDIEILCPLPNDFSNAVNFLRL